AECDTLEVTAAVVVNEADGSPEVVVAHARLPLCPSLTVLVRELGDVRVARVQLPVDRLVVASREQTRAVPALRHGVRASDLPVVVPAVPLVAREVVGLTGVVAVDRTVRAGGCAPRVTRRRRNVREVIRGVQ